MDGSFADLWIEFTSSDKAEPGAINDTGNDVILGPKLNDAVRQVANGYLRKLEFGPDYGETRATDERAKLLDLHWGRIEHDAAMLEGLGGAIDMLSGALERGVTELGESWQGESYDAFKVAIGKIRSTLEPYAAGAAATAVGLKTAMAQARKLYENYAQHSVDNTLNFSEETVSPPDKWHKVGPDQYVTERWWRTSDTDPGMDSDACEAMAKECAASRDGIKSQLDEFFKDTNDLVNAITEMMDLAVGNLAELADAEAFTSLRVIASGGGEPIDTGVVAEPVRPLPEVVVSRPDGEGRVVVTVDSGTGTPKKYELDFGAASGVPSETAPPPAGVELVLARTDGKCVIQDGDLTVTAERPLFAPESVTITVDHGSGEPTTYTLDFEAQVTSPQAWPEDDSGSLSGVLVPEQADGEAELASASDAPEPAATGRVGAGLPMRKLGRAGSGWSVHGDLFDSAEPVYSMHGVLSDDEHDAER